MASTGAVFPGSAASIDRAGSTAWATPTNVSADDGNNATSTVPTDYLTTYNYGFGSLIPDGATINGVTVVVEMSETGAAGSNYVLQLNSTSTPTLIGDPTGSIAVSGGPDVSTSGSSSDTWNAALTRTIVAGIEFGVTLWSTDTINGLQCDYITITVEYTVPVSFLPYHSKASLRRNTLLRM